MTDQCLNDVYCLLYTILTKISFPPHIEKKLQCIQRKYSISVNKDEISVQFSVVLFINYIHNELEFPIRNHDFSYKSATLENNGKKERYATVNHKAATTCLNGNYKVSSPIHFLLTKQNSKFFKDSNFFSFIFGNGVERL